MATFAPIGACFEGETEVFLSVLYNHAIRYQWMTFNPISRVRASLRRLRDKDILAPVLLKTRANERGEVDTTMDTKNRRFVDTMMDTMVANHRF